MGLAELVSRVDISTCISTCNTPLGRLRVQRRGVEDLEAITRTGSGEGRVGKLTDV
jgi:hypothetical protein